ncbi:MAG TPA: acyl-CoA dehydratase activase [Spirochaetota bacterium]|nr:acyl-CoA dehydratase activase [Spirochaetota bacterium]
MNRRGNVLGIDIGSISISVVELTPEYKVLKSGYIFHEGHVREKLESVLEDFSIGDISGIAFTSSSPDIFSTGRRYDSRVSVISAAKHFYPRPGGVLIIGGEKFGLAVFDEEGNYRNYRSNTSCAAGTGSFLDQQAKRLNLPDIETFSSIAGGNTGGTPKIASRCAVFAKTDLIHAQQEGYSLSEICDGLCEGLARNVADTLLGDEKPAGSIIMAGGVSLNGAVVKHLSALTGTGITVHEYSHLFGAMGASLLWFEDYHAGKIKPVLISGVNELFRNEKKDRRYHYDPLDLKISAYPDFTALSSFLFKPTVNSFAADVEVDIYSDLSVSDEFKVYFGIDIGSTSTKAVLTAENGEPLAGLYTRTSGRPLEAVQSILEAIDNISSSNSCRFKFLGAGTTGSGRKFVGSIINADLALDEITAHARAAYKLDPEVDTIIEIGGQDAKFTTLKNGMVTFSIMNNVCAAGTGSFVEEQAKKLGCPLSEYSGLAEGVEAPLASDRCTVFMERDLNHYLSEGFSRREVLASVLHSVRENYLTKVAIEKNIGDRIFFQGATAKNRALVAAFEQRLGKPIMVSKYCHLTGALGVALSLMDSGMTESSFRGIHLYKEAIPVRSEVCGLCANSCKIKVAEVDGETAAFGFLCGRDYETKKFINQNSSGFDLIKERAKILNANKKGDPKFDFTIGIPAALHIFDETQLWREFFSTLGIKTVVSDNFREGIKRGKGISGAEFCAPMSELHGHVAYLAEQADYVFLPSYIERKKGENNERRTYCYYTQFSPAVISSYESVAGSGKLLTPLLRTLAGTFSMKIQLYRMLKEITGGSISFMRVSSAFDSAQKGFKNSKKKLNELYSNSRRSDDVDVMLLGRPYTVLSPVMNKGIPGIFGKLGCRVFYQDMIDIKKDDSKDISDLLKSFHWRYASEILEAAEAAAKTEGLYPVLVTSFKCTPDAYAIEYFKKIMDAHGKPYLILQLDEHDSNVGYETRIEAGLRSFRNHFKGGAEGITADYSSVNPVVARESGILKGKTVLIPRWDSILGEFMAAVLQNDGIDARLVEESHDSIQRSLKHNTGQCIPLNIMVQNAVDYIRKYKIDPEDAVLWNIDSRISCNLGMFPYYSKSLLEAIGGGAEKMHVYTGNITFTDVSYRVAMNMYLAYMFGGMLRLMGCRVRPYEKISGSTDSVVKESTELLAEAFRSGGSLEETLETVISRFERIEITPGRRPRVAIFGDLYARDNDILNQNIIKVIEENGGEVITTPYSEMIKIIADPYIKRWFKEGDVLGAISSKIMKQALGLFERKYYPYFNRILNEAKHVSLPSYDEVLSRFGLEVEHTGESMENILKIFSLVMNYPDISLFVQTNPAFCCPSLVTEAMAGEIERVTGIPVVTIEYDGTGGSKNDDVIPYLKFRCGRISEKRETSCA